MSLIDKSYAFSRESIDDMLDRARSQGVRKGLFWGCCIGIPVGIALAMGTVTLWAELICL